MGIINTSQPASQPVSQPASQPSSTCTVHFQRIINASSTAPALTTTRSGLKRSAAGFTTASHTSCTVASPAPPGSGTLMVAPTPGPVPMNCALPFELVGLGGVGGTRGCLAIGMVVGRSSIGARRNGPGEAVVLIAPRPVWQAPDDPERNQPHPRHTRVRPQPLLVHRQVQHLPAPLEHRLGAVAMVDVPVYHHHPGDAGALEGVGCCDRDDVDQLGGVEFGFGERRGCVGVCELSWVWEEEGRREMWE